MTIANNAKFYANTLDGCSKHILRELGHLTSPSTEVLQGTPTVISATAGDRTGGTFTIKASLFYRGGIVNVLVKLPFNATGANVTSALEAAFKAKLNDYVLGSITTNDPELPAFGGGVDEVQFIAPGNQIVEQPEDEDEVVEARDFTLTFNLTGGESFTTALIPWDGGSNIQELIGDEIVATLTNSFALSNNGVGSTFTFSGDSVSKRLQPLITVNTENLIGPTPYPTVSRVRRGEPAGSGLTLTMPNAPLITIEESNLTGGTTDPSFSLDTAGTNPRWYFSALKALGVITGTDPAFGETPAGQYTVVQRGTNENYPSTETIMCLLKEATIAEGQDWLAEITPQLTVNTTERYELEPNSGTYPKGF